MKPRRRQTSRRKPSATKPAKQPKTFFAPAERASDDYLRKAVALASRNPVIDLVLQNFGGLIAVLNEYRQIVSVNHALLEALGVSDAAQALGLRPGEAAGCIHAHDQPGGCGTGRYCSNCGAVIAIVTAQETHQAADRDCALSVRRGAKVVDIDFGVRCVPIMVAGQQFLLLFLRDVSEERRRGALERTFFHDVANLLTSLCVAGDLLASLHKDDDLVEGLRQGVDLLAKEMDIQRSLSQAGIEERRVPKEKTSTARIFERVRKIYATHPVAAGKTLEIAPADLPLVTSPGLLVRVLMSLITNALESTPVGGEVKVRAEKERGGVRLTVWNRQAIPKGVALWVFQRYFTTKPGPGRGLGTYTVKWLTEEFLGGRVDFTSTEAAGTTFRLHLPA